MKKRNQEAFEVQWRKHRNEEKATCTKAEANFWYQIGKRVGQSALQSAFDRKKSQEPSVTITRAQLAEAFHYMKKFSGNRHVSDFELLCKELGLSEEM